MRKKLLNQPVVVDPGSESAVGFDYQIHVATRICINMLADKNIRYMLCEFHEDVVKVRQDEKLEMIQIKKRQRGKWSLTDLIKPDRGQKMGILGKLFKCIQDGKDVCRIQLVGNGGTSNGDGCSLTGLITLLSVLPAARDEAWKTDFHCYTNYIAQQLNSQGIDHDTVAKGMDLLVIDFGVVHPDAIKAENCETLAQVVDKIWNVELTQNEVNEIYNELYRHVHELALKPQKTWVEKAISREAALNIVNHYIKKFAPSSSRREIMTTQDKLTLVGLSTKVEYALQQRSSSMYLRFEIGIDSITWEDMRTEIDKRWHENKLRNMSLMGPSMWATMRLLFKELGEEWSVKDKRMGSEFVEGVFFDMTGTCDVDWRLKANE